MFYYVTYGRTYVTHDRTQEAMLTADCQKCEQHSVPVRSDPSYAKVFFNIIKYYVLLCDVRENIRDAG